MTNKTIANRLYEDHAGGLCAVLVGDGEYSQLYVDGPNWQVYEKFNSLDAAIEVMRKESDDFEDRLVVWTVGEWDAETGEYRDMYAAEPSDDGDEEFVAAPLEG